MLKSTVRLAYHGEDIVITDPCYIVTKKDWPKFCDFLEQHGLYDKEESYGVPFGAIERAGLKTLGFDRVLCVGTATGDGSCDVINSLGERLGSFGVDAGLMAVFTLKEIEEYNPALNIDNLLSCESAALVEGFDGSIQIAETNGEDDEEYGTLVSVIGTGRSGKFSFRSDGI